MSVIIPMVLILLLISCAPDPAPKLDNAITVPPSANTVRIENGEVILEHQ